MWRVMTGVSDKCCEMAAQLVEDYEDDVKYIVSAWSADSNISNLANKLAENFVIRYGVESTQLYPQRTFRMHWIAEKNRLSSIVPWQTC